MVWAKQSKKCGKKQWRLWNHRFSTTTRTFSKNLAWRSQSAGCNRQSIPLQKPQSGSQRGQAWTNRSQTQGITRRMGASAHEGGRRNPRESRKTLLWGRGSWQNSLPRKPRKFQSLGNQGSKEIFLSFSNQPSMVGINALMEPRRCSQQESSPTRNEWKGSTSGAKMFMHTNTSRRWAPGQSYGPNSTRMGMENCKGRQVSGWFACVMLGFKRWICGCSKKKDSCGIRSQERTKHQQQDAISRGKGDHRTEKKVKCRNCWWVAGSKTITSQEAGLAGYRNESACVSGHFPWG